MTPPNANSAVTGGVGGDAVDFDNHSISPSTTDPSSFGVTLGRGKNRPQGCWRELTVWSPVALSEVIKRHTGFEAWFCLSRFAAGTTKRKRTVSADYRDGGTFLYAVGCGADIDTEGHRDLLPAERKALLDYWKSGHLPGDLFYLTPAGCRLLHLFRQAEYDPSGFIRRAEEFENLAVDALDKLGLTSLVVDPKCTRDRARFFYAPNCKAKGIRRKADVFYRQEGMPLQATATQASEPTLPVSAQRQGVRRVSGVREVRGDGLPLALSDEQRGEVEAAIKSTVPASFGTRNDCLLRFLCRLKGILGVRDATPQQLRPAIRSWWERCKQVNRDKDFTETWTSVLSAWPNTRGEGAFLASALLAAETHPDPFAQGVSDYLAMRDEASFQRFVAFLCELDANSGGKVWYISNDKVGEVIGVGGKTAWRWLEVLKKQGVLIEVEPPRKRQRRAARYKLNRDWTP